MNKFLKCLMIVSIVVPLLFQSSIGLAVEGKPRRGIATIIFAGLGGAVIGLSTLSFYGEPQKHLNNISIGFAAGVILGTGYVTYEAATASNFQNSIYQIGKDSYRPTNPAQIYASAPSIWNYRFEF
ncbi:MAG: hypothetical protein AB7O96_02315 [Pseudobdellovibrionaceae bacterium]